MADLSTAPLTLQSAVQECDSHVHRLEQLEVLPSAADWQFFRNLRNNLAHDYPETIDQTVLTLNTLHSHWPRLRDFYQHIRTQLHSRHAHTTITLCLTRERQRKAITLRR